MEGNDNKAEVFQKKDIIFSEAIGVCKIEEVTNLTQQNGQTITYYGLRSVKDKNKTAYVPVENHSVVLRRLIDETKAKEIKNTTYEKESEIVKFEVDYVIKMATN